MELVDHARSGRVFLIGDAAHLNPPFGGHGLNTGIGDAVDLGWKLAAVLQGWGGPGLLDSYEAERRPLQRRVIDEATANGSVLSGRFVKDGLDEPGPHGQELRAAAAAEIQATKAMEYFSLDLVLGHRYQDSPVIPPTTGEISDADWATVAAPGRRLPHQSLPDGRSTLDLIGPGLNLIVQDGADVSSLALGRRRPRHPARRNGSRRRGAGRLGRAIAFRRRPVDAARPARPDRRLVGHHRPRRPRSTPPADHGPGLIPFRSQPSCSTPSSPQPTKTGDEQ